MTRFESLRATLRTRYLALPRPLQLVVMALGASMAVVLIYAPIVRFNAYRARIQQEIETYREEVEHLRGYVARAEQVERDRELLAKRLDGLADRLVPGEKPEIAAARLQDHITNLAGSTAVSVQSTQVMRHEPMGPYVQVTLRLVVRASVKALADFLNGIEYGGMQLSVPFLQIDRRGAAPRPSRVDPSVRAEERMLSATVEVRGFTAAPADAPAAEPEPAVES
jgi:hypothetical protein